MVAADEVPIPKPAPDLYLAGVPAARRASGCECVAFEDTGTGAAAARAAGMLVVGVPSLEPDGFPADVVLASLADPRLLAWAALALTRRVLEPSRPALPDASRTCT